MAIDRAAVLRAAEALLRQGQIEPAIAEYLRVVEDNPRDWKRAITRCDLYALELRGLAGSFRDVTARIERLTRSQARG